MGRRGRVGGGYFGKVTRRSVGATTGRGVGITCWYDDDDYEDDVYEVDDDDDEADRKDERDK
ncbi:hypothetical protein E2C01_035874 [Portunus trituberculatus]|uniref:Uncharacterized protein n=1 Tax=Portunus trituberculatus TaxID=210409 RepID=A0A5B7FAW6_PORTR|nr:hypothetical protein [Portunus trituberculatus]